MTEPMPHLIRKYANRKLYDTTTSRYVTLSGIWALVCSGHDVRVVEHDTGNDITAVVLSQIVASHERTTAIASTPDAAQAAQARRDTLIDYLRRTLGGSAAQMGDEMGRRTSELASALQEGLNRGGAFAAVFSDDLGRRGSELAAELGRRRIDVEEVVDAAVKRAVETFAFSERDDLAQLRRRVEDLEQRVARVQTALRADLEQAAAAESSRAD